MTARQCAEAVTMNTALFMCSAFLTDDQIVIGEITAIPDLSEDIAIPLDVHGK